MCWSFFTTVSGFPDTIWYVAWAPSYERAGPPGVMFTAPVLACSRRLVRAAWLT